MAKKKAKKNNVAVPHVHPTVAPRPVAVSEAEDELFDLSDPDEFRKAFIASEILNRKY